MTKTLYKNYKKTALTVSNFDAEMASLPSKLNLCRREFLLLLEAYRRKNILKCNPNLFGLGIPTRYKSDLFECSFIEIRHTNNWYKLTKKGEEKMALLETLIEILPTDIYNINNKMFSFN